LEMLISVGIKKNVLGRIAFVFVNLSPALRVTISRVVYFAKVYKYPLRAYAANVLIGLNIRKMDSHARYFEYF
jgi:hypothetical protein